MRVGAVVLVVPLADQQHVAHDDPPAARTPAGLDHHGAGEVAPRRGDVHVGRADPEQARVAVEQRAEHARRVHPRQAHPFHVAARSDQRAGLGVREEAVLGDRREGASHRQSWADVLPHRSDSSPAAGGSSSTVSEPSSGRTRLAGASGSADAGEGAADGLGLVLPGDQEHHLARRRQHAEGSSSRAVRAGPFLDCPPQPRADRSRRAPGRAETATRCGRRGRARAAPGRAPASPLRKRRRVLRRRGRPPHAGRARPRSAGRPAPGPGAGRAARASPSGSSSARRRGRTQRSSPNHRVASDQSAARPAARSYAARGVDPPASAMWPPTAAAADSRTAAVSAGSSVTVMSGCALTVAIHRGAPARAPPVIPPSRRRM